MKKIDNDPVLFNVVKIDEKLTHVFTALYACQKLLWIVTILLSFILWRVW